MKNTQIPSLPVAVHMRRTSTCNMSILRTSSVASVTTTSYFRTNYTIFELASAIDEDISTEDALDIDGDGGDSDI